jgi:hypothetical protein
MKIKNKDNGAEADVPEFLGELLVKAGGWESAAPAKSRRVNPVEEPEVKE